MTDYKYAHLTDRSIIDITGPDSQSFLQGLITQDITKLSSNHDMIYSALLTANGKFLHDFFITKPTQNHYQFWIETERRDDFMKRLQIYALRADIQITDACNQYDLYYAMGEVTDHIAYTDPRGLNGKLFQTTSGEQPQNGIKIDLSDYYKFCMQQNTPIGSQTMPIKLADIQQYNLEELNAIAFDKGCFLGQEPVARIHYRGLLKQKLFCLISDQKIVPPPEELHILYNQEGQKIGEICQILDHYALALLKLRYIDDHLQIQDDVEQKFQIYKK